MLKTRTVAWNNEAIKLWLFATLQHIPSNWNNSKQQKKLGQKCAITPKRNWHGTVRIDVKSIFIDADHRERTTWIINYSVNCINPLMIGWHQSWPMVGRAKSLNLRAIKQLSWFVTCLGCFFFFFFVGSLLLIHQQRSSALPGSGKINCKVNRQFHLSLTAAF